MCAATRPVSANSGPQASPKCRRGLGKMLSQSAGRAATMVQLQQQLLAAEALGQQQARAYKALLESRRSHESPCECCFRSCTVHSWFMCQCYECVLAAVGAAGTWCCFALFCAAKIPSAAVLYSAHHHGLLHHDFSNNLLLPPV